MKRDAIKKKIKELTVQIKELKKAFKAKCKAAKAEFEEKRKANKDADAKNEAAQKSAIDNIGKLLEGMNGNTLPETLSNIPAVVGAIGTLILASNHKSSRYESFDMYEFKDECEEPALIEELEEQISDLREKMYESDDE